MSRLPTGQENAGVNYFGPSASLSTVQSITASQVTAKLDPYKSNGKRIISDVRRTFCLFVTFDLLFVGLLWIIELNVDGGIIPRLKNEVVRYDFHKSYFDIFLLAVFRFLMLVFAYALCRLHHWWVIAITTAVTSAFLIAKVIISKLLVEGTAFAYLLPIISFILAWIETWFLDFKVLPQEAKDENRIFTISDASEQAPLILPGPLSDGQFYSPPESVVDSEEEDDAEYPMH
ncbi:STARD3 N-terminal-like protein [Pristis pectinata]|uniref:STARD3 N-terminal-like protein n=1 Tax=Pristis pectinata TaxID=685728 RepID=UPI00223D9A01|nr:STARD3 N-terminal-like protein [Pristis pectinata]XP_051879668.1 STARD3 N-terminal-like protein [Pristis pectinata]XP_051879669.1 STARD3 N-terminal-like protein [Pristis pectinata]XP_051879670.1 STARD3 N-terminal-like protein [Pristis pectinata]XP_051879671.1 STARD3 N-terminal-like protein [Pristis pectinata]XP_051879672.1 STARD3 N-terminal-like protein [Pristis pectinata]XP_051879673.1 STARD3 N-terminal-like protein [Pristis pectinata]